MATTSGEIRPPANLSWELRHTPKEFRAARAALPEGRATHEWVICESAEQSRHWDKCIDRMEVLAATAWLDARDGRWYTDRVLPHLLPRHF